MLVRPRSTSKSGAKRGCLGTRESAEEISRWSSAEGEQTFSMLTLTLGCDACCALAYPRSPTQARKKIFPSTQEFYQGLADGLAFSALLSLFSSRSSLSAGSGQSCYGDCGTGSSLLMYSSASSRQF